MNAPRIKIVDSTDVPHPEDRAMIQAMYSRSNKSVDTHLEKVKQVGSGKFMSQYYIGYGHESIGELGDTTIYIEGVSMLAAKCIQDNALYRGQESSTRYIDFQEQPFYVPDMHSAYVASYEQTVEIWRKLYIEALTKVEPYVRNLYPPEHMLPSGITDMSIYEKSIKAATFDICRGLLPIAATTNVAWTGDLRTIARHARVMINHSLSEVQRIGHYVYAALRQRYPNSCALLGSTETVDRFYNKSARDSVFSMTSHVDEEFIADMHVWPLEMFSRSRLEMLPPTIANAAWFTITDAIDFASYRDVQRHRPGYMSLSKCRSIDIPLAMNHTKNWYAKHLSVASPGLWERIKDQLQMQHTELTLHEPERKTYQIPMMVPVALKVKWNLGQLIYFCNLRSGVTVHPTVRHMAKRWATVATERLGRNFFTLDIREDYQSTRRGQQDIVART